VRVLSSVTLGSLVSALNIATKGDIAVLIYIFPSRRHLSTIQAHLFFTIHIEYRLKESIPVKITARLITGSYQHPSPPPFAPYPNLAAIASQLPPPEVVA